MRFSFRLKFVLLCAAVVGQLQSQTFNLDPDAPLPVDKNVTVGQLENGLKYYIRENKKPEGRARLRLVVNAGSLQEEDDQRGLAHFVEHMAFNGTANFEKNEMIHFLEGIGMRFGSHLNAYTSFNETVYMIEIPLDDPTVLETSMQILADWAGGITFDPYELEKERGVVEEEWRARQGAGQRLVERQYPFIYYNSKYAERLPIGSMVVVKRAPPQRFIDFYNDWYRPNLMAVIAVGDFQSAFIEDRIREYFQDLENPVDAPERLPTEVPDHEETLVSIETDPELTVSSVRIHIKGGIDPDVTASDYKRHIVERLYYSMINQRLAERTREANPPFINAGVGKTKIAREKQSFTLSVVFFENRYDDGLNALIAEVNRAIRDGFSATELERMKADVLRSLERAYDERDKTNSLAYTNEYTRAFTVDEPIPGIEMELAMTRHFLKEISLDEVNAVGEVFKRKGNRVILFSAPEKEGLIVPSEEELVAAIDSASKIQLAAYDDRVSDAPLLEDLPEPGDIVSETYHESVDTHEWSLSNGIRVIAKKTDFQNDQILMTSFSPGGSSLAMDDEYVSAITATMIVTESGLGDLDAIQLDKKLAGKALGVSPYINDQYEGFNGSTSPKDIELFFQMLWMYARQPRVDDKAIDSMTTRLNAVIANRLKNPNAVFQDEISKAFYGDHLRHRPMSQELMREIDPGLALAIYKNRFNDFSDFTFVFVGAIDLDELKGLTKQYLASLPKTNRVEKGVFRDDKPASGQLVVNVDKGLEEKTSTRVIFTGDAEWSPENQYAMSVVRDLLNIRLRESLREENSGTYGVGVFGSISREPIELFTTGFAFSSDPANTDALIRIAFSEIQDLQETGPRLENMAKVREIHLRGREKSEKTNNFWRQRLAAMARQGRDFSDILGYETMVSAFNAKDAQEAANNYFDFDNVLIARLNPNYQE